MLSLSSTADVKLSFYKLSFVFLCVLIWHLEWICTTKQKISKIMSVTLLLQFHCKLKLNAVCGQRKKYSAFDLWLHAVSSDYFLASEACTKGMHCFIPSHDFINKANYILLVWMCLAGMFQDIFQHIHACDRMFSFGHTSFHKWNVLVHNSCWIKRCFQTATEKVDKNIIVLF